VRGATLEPAFLTGFCGECGECSRSNICLGHHLALPEDRENYCLAVVCFVTTLKIAGFPSCRLSGDGEANQRCRTVKKNGVGRGSALVVDPGPDSCGQKRRGHPQNHPNIRKRTVFRMRSWAVPNTSRAAIRTAKKGSSRANFLRRSAARGSAE
jgi:hypothetical protein